MLPTDFRDAVFLVGPTASGKSDIALRLAERWSAEIIALDSMTLYRGMDIGTAKPTPADRIAVPHHLLDVLDPQDDYSVAQYAQAASEIVREIQQRGRVPLFVGGSGLYLRTLLRGLFEGPPADWRLRAELEQFCVIHGAAALHDRLRGVDPTTADRLSPSDVRRVTRALEVHTLTGQPLSSQQRQPALPVEQRARHVYWLSPDRDWLYERINRRVELMFERGLLQEVQDLLRRPCPLSHTARQALGYKETIDWIERGTGSLAEVITEIQTRTRQFAKRQLTWFRNLQETIPVEVAPTETVDDIADRLDQQWHTGQ